MRKSPLAALLLLILSAVLSAKLANPDLNAAYKVNKTKSRVEFLVHSFFADINGVFSSYQVALRAPTPRVEDMSLSINADAVSVQLGSSDKDKTIRGQHFFWVAKYPTIVLVSRRIVADPGNPSRFKMDADFTLRGVTKPVIVQLLLEPGDVGHRRLRGELSFDRRAFGMTYNMPFNHISDSVQMRFDLAMEGGPPRT
jgi:polyisoprenoid-binding protein YceI